MFRSQLNSNRDTDITVTGVSMEPSLCEGDVVTIRRAESYEKGDILVFCYKNNELLIHRLLRIKDQRYFCKGDNAFRLEDILYEQIFGKVVKINGEDLPSVTTQQIELSYMVNRAFRKNGYQVDKTKKSGIYRFYQKYINKEENLTVTYQKNKDMDYISVDETSLAVFDAESGDTHFFDETGVDILNCLEMPITMEDLLVKLCEIYDASPQDIRADVEEFIAECIVKKVVIAL
jgi:PqqD family protein of HPr-rel-A system